MSGTHECKGAEHGSALIRSSGWGPEQSTTYNGEHSQKTSAAECSHFEFHLQWGEKSPGPRTLE